MKNWSDREMQRIADEGKWIKGKALTFATLLIEGYGADPTRLSELAAYRDAPIVTVPAIVVDYIVALLMHVAPQRPGPKTRQSTLDALRLQRVLGVLGISLSQRMAGKIVVDKINEDPAREEEDADAIRQRLVALKRIRSGKARSGKAPSPKSRPPHPLGKPPSRKRR